MTFKKPPGDQTQRLLNLQMVELAGIEPASTSHFRTVLHV